MLALVELARSYRTRPDSQGKVHSYRAEAEGHVYFYLDREDGGDPIPMRVDQVAVDLYWKAPDSTYQDIRALRKRELLPVKDFRYYIDRLTAVQNGFGDVISVGQGRDVRSVPHPLSPLGRTLYRFRIVDEITVTVPSMPAPVKVYEVDVRPVDEAIPAFVGSLFLEASTGALTRTRFTFTPASYVDPRVDNITVALEHALWEDRHWLPYKQVLEVRREMPEIDLPVGSMIRATLEVDSYEFNPELSPRMFRGPRVTSRGYRATDSTEFNSGLMENMEAEGLSPITMAELESEARRTIRTQLVSGLPRIRLYTDRFSSVARANRAEGAYLGVGASLSPHPAVRVEGMGGYGTGSQLASATSRVLWQPPNHPTTTLTAELRGRETQDLGPLPGASGAVSSLSAVLWNEDLVDPWFASGITLGFARELDDGSHWRVGARYDRHEPARQAWFTSPVGDGPLRPVRPAEEGDLTGVQFQYSRRWGGEAGWGAASTLTGGADRWEGRSLGTARASVSARLSSPDLSRRVSLAVEAGSLWGDAPGQLLYFLGGRGTLPGHPYRAFGGRRFALAAAEASLQLLPGWITARLIGGAGAVGGTPEPLGSLWGVRPTGNVKGYVGFGAGTLHDLLRIDGAWGVGGGGGFELVISVDPRLGPYL